MRLLITGIGGAAGRAAAKTLLDARGAKTP